ncbi:MAG: sulfatase [Candidatus Hydrogenedens sp.]|jgi:arylsulfatase A-like enzyme|nr:sulfatase [Candidatus Hydrogenedens sp.]
MKSISRRQFNSQIALATGALFTRSALTSSAAEEYERPNIVFLLADDMRWNSLGCMGDPVIQTPNLDRLGREGHIFDQCRVTTSICCSSRASILSGQYVCAHGIDDFAKTFDETAYAQCYPALLRGHGYHTGFVGKYGIGTELPEGTYDFWRGFGGQGHYETRDEAGTFKHLNEVTSEDCLEFLEQCPKDRPFSLSVSFKAPHCQDGDERQFIHEKEYDSLYAGKEMPIPATNDISYEDHFPEFFKNNNEARVRWLIRFADAEMQQESIRKYYRLITGMDRVVGEIRDKVEALGLGNNTVFIFTSDNGFFLGDFGLAGKWYGYESSIRVPLIIYDPRLSAARRSQRHDVLALNLDLAPTMLDLAGIPIPAGMQGQSLVPWLLGRHVSWRSDFYYEHNFHHPGIPKSEGIVSEEWKYLCYHEETPVYEELFNLKTDPHETRNLAGNPGSASVLHKMRERYTELKEECCL